MRQKEKHPRHVKIAYSDRAALMKYARDRPSKKGVSAWTGLRTKGNLFTEVCHVADNLRLNHGVMMNTEIRRDAGANETCGFIVFKRFEGYNGKKGTKAARAEKIGEYRFTSLSEVEDMEFPESHRNWTPEGLKIAWIVENSYNEGNGFPSALALSDGIAYKGTGTNKSSGHWTLHSSEEAMGANPPPSEEPSPPGHFGRGKHLRLVTEHEVTLSKTQRAIRTLTGWGRGSSTND